LVGVIEVSLIDQTVNEFDLCDKDM